MPLVPFISVIHSCSSMRMVTLWVCGISGNNSKLAFYPVSLQTSRESCYPPRGLFFTNGYSSTFCSAQLEPNNLWEKEQFGKNCVKQLCKAVAITIGFFRISFKFLEHTGVRLSSWAAKVHHTAAICTNFFVKTEKLKCELESFRSILVSHTFFSNSRAKIKNFVFFLKKPSLLPCTILFVKCGH